MISTKPAPTVYLVAIDGTSCSAHALEVACSLGAALGGVAELNIVHALGSAMPPAVMTVGPTPEPDGLEAGRALLDRACAEAKTRFKGRVTGHLAAGDAWREIVQLGSNLSADLIIVGTAGRTGIARLALGSVAEKVVRHAGCPVLVARPKSYEGQVEIEPPCPDCVKVQNESERARLWCDRHTTHHPHGRLHYETPQTFGVGSMNFRP